MEGTIELRELKLSICLMFITAKRAVIALSSYDKSVEGSNVSIASTP